MKSKLITTVFGAFLFLLSQLQSMAQADCYDIQCPTNIVVPCEGVYGAHASYAVIASNRCQPTVTATVSYSVPPGSLFPPGTNVVCATIQIPGTPARQCCFNVIVEGCCSSNCIDVVCPKNILVGCQQTAGPPGATVVIPNPVATNYCGDHIIPSTYFFRCSYPPGQPTYFPPGTNTVTCCLTDGQKYMNCCCFQVIVTNCPSPVGVAQCTPRIICPTNMEMQCVNNDGAIVFFPNPQILDPCNLVVGTNASHLSGQFFPNGKTTVSWCITYVDPTTGNKLVQCCCFDVVVRCCPPPTNCVTRLDCPGDITVDCAAGGAVLNYFAFGTNNCQQTQLICVPPPGTIIYGSTNVCCRLTGNNGIVLTQCCFKVTVADTLPPHIACPGDITVVSSNCGPVAVALPVVTATDNCDPNPHVVCSPILNAYPCGLTPITCTATDANGNSSSCTFNVSVICNSRTEIACPQDMIFNCASRTGVVVSYSVFATNRCTNIVEIKCNPPSGSVFLPGTTQVCCDALAANGEAARCCFKITVNPDDVPPSIVCPSNVFITAANCQPIQVDYPAPSATDNCQLDFVRCTPPAGSLFPIGVTGVTCCAVDKAGNTNCCNFTVTVRCQTNCVQLICPSNIVVDCAGPNGAQVPFKVYATNICDGTAIPVACAIPSGSFFPPGVTTVCCTNFSSAAAAPQVCCFTVTVRTDTVPPTITCPSNMVVFSPNCAPMPVEYPAPTASDNCQLDTVACNPAGGSNFPLGVSTVTCCAVDKAGNKACCSFTITVRCDDCTKLICPSNVVVNCAGPNGAQAFYDAYVLNTCTGAIQPASCSRPSGSFFPPGVTTVCCTNLSSPSTAPQFCCFDVTVRRDTQPPVITCPSNIYVLCATPNGAKVNYTVGVTDACDPAPSLTCVPPSGSLFKLGCTNVVCVATDHAGNASTCSFRVCVLPQGCYLVNPSFEQLVANAPPANACGDIINLAVGWSALSGTPDLFRPPFASLAPGNCRGKENPCQGTNYAGLEGGYTASGGFATEEMMGTLIAPLSNGKSFRLRACLSLAESSPGPVVVEFVLANSANLAQQQVIHQVLVKQTVGWMQYQPPCFEIPQLGNWDRLIIRMARVGPGVHPYQTGYVYVDSVNICCCKPVLGNPTFTPNGVAVTWDGAGQLQGTGKITEPTEWHNINTPVEFDPETGLYKTLVPVSLDNLFFRVVGPDGTIECTECSGGGGGAGGS